MASRVPQVLLTLTPEGKLAVELPGHQATRRQLEICTAEAGETLLRILEAQARDQAEIGLDGAPTAAQVRHWERHSIWGDSRCRFCIAEGRAWPDHSIRREKRTIVVEKRADGVEIRRIREGAKAPKPLAASANKLGL